MKQLCDANVWLGLTLQSHPFRPAAMEWFTNLDTSDTLVLCRSTQHSLLRLLTNKFVCGDEVRTNREAVAGYKLLRENSRVEWLEEPQDLERLWLEYAGINSTAPNTWMDAYLAAFAVLTKCRLVTFDKGFRVYKGLDWLNLNPG